jgi:hypothetical protein
VERKEAKEENEHDQEAGQSRPGQMPKMEGSGQADRRPYSKGGAEKSMRPEKCTSEAKAPIDFVALTAPLEPCPEANGLFRIL